MSKKTDNKNGPKGEHKQIPKIPLRDAKAQIMEAYEPARRVIYHLYAEAIIPGMKYEAIDDIRGALVDVTKRLKAKDEAQGHWDKVLADRDKKTKLQREELHEVNRHLLAAVGKYQEREKEFHGSVEKVGKKLDYLKPLIMKKFGAEGYLDKNQDDENQEFIQFCRHFLLVFYEKRDTMADVKVILGIVERACAALEDWAGVYQREDISDLMRTLRTYTNWTGEAKEGVEIQKDIVGAIAAKLRQASEEAERLKAQREKKVASAREKLNGAMKEMKKLHDTWISAGTK